MSSDAPLYESRRKAYPRAVSGTFRNLKWLVMIATLGVYYITPWIRWDRGIGRPDQAVLIDFPGRRFYFFFIELWPQEVYYFTGLLIMGALAIFLLNALFGRVWCGYSCPQTVWTDLFLAIERWVEGDRNKRMRQDQNRWRSNVLSKKLLKYFIFFFISLATGGAWVFYFADAPTLFMQFISFEAPPAAMIWVAVFTATTFILGGFMREQVCIYMCPWPRIQAAMTDDEALNVTYRYDRGEPRQSLKSREQAIKTGAAYGDCIDCMACVNVCPVGIDIRDGLQLECIHCALCIDACNETMAKVKLPLGLVAYDTDTNIARRQQGQAPIIHLLRPRTMIYAALLLLVTALMVVSYMNRQDTTLTAQRERNPLFVTLKDGSVRNDFTLKLSNRSQAQQRYLVELVKPEFAHIDVSGIQVSDNQFEITLPADQLQSLRVHVTVPADKLAETLPVLFTATPLIIDNITGDAQRGESAMADDYFKGK